MRSTLRSLTFGLAAALAGAAMAQQPYTISLFGTMTSCYPGQTVNVQTIQGTQPAYNFDVPVEPGTCSWSASLGVSSNPASFMASTLCNGMVVSFTDSVGFNFVQDSAYVFITFDCGGIVYDCNGVLNGPALPGTACDDGDVLSTNDTWQADCSCAGTYAYDCEGVINGPALPGTACDDGDSLTTTDAWSIYCDCMGDSSYYDSLDCMGVFLGPDMPGTPCDDSDPLTLNDVWSPNCYCYGLDTNNYDCNGVINGPDMPGTSCDDGNPVTQNDAWNSWCYCTGDTLNSPYDCLGVLNGPNVPGAPCVDFFGNTGIWSADCSCQTNNIADCLGVPGGTAWPGTVCVFTPDSGNTFITDIWSADCVCGDTTNIPIDCLGNPNGSALPGTLCTIPGTILEGTWSSECVCEANSTDSCEADFWVIQAMGPDSLPVPYELWVWNLSSSGSQLSYSWDFGDGTSSTEAFPTHTYSGNGPYQLCLTVLDNNCEDTHCDSISINADGVYEGMVVHAEDRQDGFTINVQDGQSTAVQEVVTAGNIATWPNPALDELNVAVVSEMKGLVTLSITDLDGRTVRTERTSLSGGRSQLRITTSGLNAGMYLLRISDGTVNLSQRFVKTN